MTISKRIQFDLFNEVLVKKVYFISTIIIGLFFLLSGCSEVAKSYNSTYDHVYHFDTYKERLLPVDKPSGRIRLQQEADYDSVVNSYIEDHGKPDYIYVESRYLVYAFYRSPDKFVIFKRSIFNPQLSTVKEESSIPDIFNRKMPPMQHITTDDKSTQISTIKSSKILEAQSNRTPVVQSAPVVEDASEKDMSGNIDVTLLPNLASQEKVADRIQIDDETIQRLIEGAKEGDSEAQNILGQAYSSGYFGFGKNDHKASIWFTKAAEQGHPDAQYSIGNMYWNGQGVTKDIKAARHWYTEAANQGHADAQCMLGITYIPQDYTKAFKWFKESAEQGNADAQMMLGGLYQNGQGVPQNYKEAFNWFQKAAHKGITRAEYHVGHKYKYGQGVRQDYKKALWWLKKAADKGSKEAQHLLGLMYLSGQGVQENPKEALKWVHKSAVQGHEEAQNLLGGMYFFGKGTPINYIKAYAWISLACAQGVESQRTMLLECKENMTSEQIAEAQAMASEIWETNKR